MGGFELARQELNDKRMAEGLRVNLSGHQMFVFAARKGAGGVTMDYLMQILLREYPNGVSFAPMALRLLQQKVPLKESQIEGLKAQMFQLGDGLWFSSGMISDENAQAELRSQAATWMAEQGCFSVERLFEGFCSLLRNIATTEHFAAFLRHLGFTVAAWRNIGFFCFQPPASLDERLAEASKTIVELLEEADGMLALNEIEEAMPHLTAEALEGLRMQFLPEVHMTEVGGIPCWRDTKAIHLPDDFAERLTTAVDTLVALGEKVSAAKLGFALNLFYGIRFREEYALPDNGAFMRVCAKYYQGGNYAFPNMKKPRVKADGLSVPAKRRRSPNTRFCNLGVPIGTELVFTKDIHITCTVMNDSNQVQYDGKAWAISALATHLLSVSSANGFYYFSCEGETLWDRRLRLEREGVLDGNPAKETPSPAAVRDAESGIIGLSGQPLSLATWHAFKSAGTNPRVAEWERRIKMGESIDEIAQESGYAVSTVKVQVGDRRRYFKACEINKIVPEGGADV
jgi:hypothetical protein